MEGKARTEGISTVGKEATYVEAARRGGHRWWRYLVGLVVILEDASHAVGVSQPEEVAGVIFAATAHVEQRAHKREGLT